MIIIIIYCFLSSLLFTLFLIRKLQFKYFPKEKIDVENRQ